MRFLLSGLLSVAICVPMLTQAATLYIDPGMVTLFRGDAVKMSVRLMPEQASGECVNAADVVITYPASIQPVDVSIGRSIFSVWVEDPVINKEERTITFAGGIPNGYCGRVQGDPGLTNIVADVVFRSPGLQIGSAADDSTAVVSFTDETNVYLNYGQGTKATLVTLPSTISLEKNAGSAIVDEWRENVADDDIPPESFSIQLERDPIAFGGKYYIIFSTTDKQTGVSHYEVMEEPVSEFGTFSWGATDAPWLRAQSPYILDDQSLNSTIRVRAYDKAGNEYVATLVPEESMRTVSKQAMYTYASIGVASVVLLFALVGIFVYIRRYRKARGVTPSSQVPDNSLAEDDENIV
jgi:hypothetical protein